MSDDDQLVFPATLTNTERKYVHEVCSKLGLKSKSQGKNEHRFLSVFKPNLVPLQGGSSLLKISPAAVRALEAVFANQPIQPWELDVVGGRPNAQFAAAHAAAAARATAQSASARKPRRGPSASTPAPRTSVTPPSVSTARMKLPIYKHRDEIVSQIAAYPVTIVSGETGSGKSTQVVQFLLDQDPTHVVVCTQPRRLSAIALAERVAEERGETGTVGYAVRLESQPGSRLMFCTTGVVLSSLRNGLRASQIMSGCTHLVIDEIHERDRNADFLLAIAREVLVNKASFKLVLMSATMSVDTFARYFAEVGVTCGQVAVSGSQFPVRQLFLEDALHETRYCERLLLKASELASAASGHAEEKKLACPMCGLSKFASAAAFGVHAAECTGVLGVSSRSGSRAGASEASEDAPPAGMGSLLGGLSSDDEDVDVWGGAAAGSMADVSLPPVDSASTAASTSSAASETRPEDASNLKAYLDSRSDEENEADLALIVALLERIEAVGDASFFTRAAPSAMAVRSDAVLIFLPGWAEISRLCDLLQAHLVFGDASKYLVLALHSGVPTKEQRRVFVRPPPKVRKVVVATNIAETSITIDDIVYVIDSGLMKEKSYDPVSKVNTLLPMFVSRANAVQRKGRAGRCRHGVCFHLMSRTRYSGLPAEQVPEMCRTPLDELCLQVRALLDSAEADAIFNADTTVAEFFAKCPTPPSTSSILNAMDLLRKLGALDANEGITKLGRILAALPVEVRAGKTLLLGAFLKCPGVALTLACSSGFRDVFVVPLGAGERAAAKAARARFAAGQQGVAESDHAASLGAYALYMATKRRAGAGAARALAANSFLQANTLETLEQMRAQVQRNVAGASPLLAAKDGEGNPAAVLALVCAATQPNLAYLREGAVKLMSGAETKITPHSASAVRVSKDQGETFYVFEELVRGPRQCLMRNATPVPALCVALFCGFMSAQPAVGDGFGGGGGDDDGDEDDDDDEMFKLVGLPGGTSEIRVKSWVRLTAPSAVAEKVAVLRLRFEQAFLRAVERGRVDAAEQRIADAVINVVMCDLMGAATLAQPARPLSGARR